jgi:apolipoprotein N-acyltransferase
MSIAQLEIHKPIRERYFVKYIYIIKTCFAGLLLPLGFAPFHFPGLAILGLAILFAELQNLSYKKSAISAFIFGFSFMGFGVSWIFVSIHLYGNLNIVLSSLITILFVCYLSLFYIIQGLMFNFLQKKASKIFRALIFSATWCLCEFLRANFASGFPWLIIGFGQMDSPLQHLMPYIGVYGVSFLTCMAASFLYLFIQSSDAKKKNLPYLLIFLFIILSPNILQKVTPNTHGKSFPVGVIQANLSMRDKWDDAIFEDIINRYKNGIDNLKENTKLIVLPESAIPVPQDYAKEFINEIKLINKKYKTQVLIGIPKEADKDGKLYYNALTSFGNGKKTYLKQHLVPFGEYIPKPFSKIAEYLDIPDASMIKGPTNQSLLKYHNMPFATLICFEAAYPEILRTQLPKARWIVSVSDAGWFGHSLAIYQLLQMSQVLSKMTGRYQVVANNNGLSSIIDDSGKIINSLPAFSSMNLYGNIYPSYSKTIWTIYGDKPYLYLCIVIIIIALFSKKSYSYKST